MYKLYNSFQYNLEQGCANFFIESQLVDILGFIDQISVTAVQLCCCSVEAATDNI